MKSAYGKPMKTVAAQVQDWLLKLLLDHQLPPPQLRLALWGTMHSVPQDNLYKVDRQNKTYQASRPQYW